jgi:hypothetical protein
MTSPAILYPDVTATVASYLDDNLTAAVHAREPNPFVTPLVTVRRVGGADSVVVDRARIDLQVWADDLAAATDLANLARAYMLAMPGVRDTVTVYDVTTFSGPSLIWDDDRNLPRYLLTFEVAVRGAAL